MSAAFLRDTVENMRAAARMAPIIPYAAYAPAGTEEILRPLIGDDTRLLLADGSGAAPPGVEGLRPLPAAGD